MSSKLISALKAAEFLLEKDKFVILTHANPDGDTLGSGFALNASLRQLGKASKVICPDAIPSKFQFLVPDSGDDFEYETVVAVDVADEKLLGELEDDFKGKVELCIDHHGSNLKYAQNLYLESDSAAACECVYDVIKALGVEITPYIANSLYLGMATDTGCFKFSNVTPRTHRYAAELMEFGADYDEINRVMFEVKSKSRIAMEKQVLQGMEFFCDGRCALITVTKDMIDSTGCEPTDLDGITALSRQIEGVLIGITIKEKEQGVFKVSLRTFEPYDAAEICKNFGGGGHKRAAGCEFKKPLDEIRKLLVEKVTEVIETEKK